MHNQIQGNPIGSHQVNVMATSTQPSVEYDIPSTSQTTSARFCQNSSARNIVCMATQNIGDVFLTRPEPTTFSANQPWHAVTLNSGVRGSTLPWAYGSFADTQVWNFTADAQTWLGAGATMVPTPPDAAGDGNNTDCTSGNLTRCLDGLFWVNSNSPIGDTVNTAPFLLGNLNVGVTVGTHGPQLSNHYGEIRPDRGQLWYCPLPSPLLPGGCGSSTTPTAVPLRFFNVANDALRTTALGNLIAVVPETRFVYVAPLATPVLGFLQRDGSGVVPSDSQGHCGSATPSTTLTAHLSDHTLSWASAVEPNDRIGPIDWEIAGVAMSADGTHLYDSAINVAGNVYSACDGAALNTVRELPPGLCGTQTSPPPPRGPSARSGFKTVYSRSAGGLFVLGGNDATTHAQLSDIWFLPLGGGVWQLIPVQNYSLGQVLAATYSFRDRRLWVIDSIPGAGGVANTRLSRIDPEGASAVVLATWVPGPFVSAWFLSIDQDGGVLASATSELLQVSLTARIALNTGSPLITLIFPDVGSIFTTPAVDDNGYSLVVGGVAPNSLAIHRFNTMSGLLSQPQTCDQLAQLEKMGH